ncbi:hypothetical protein ACSFC1_03665 [Pseudothermotoga sp. U03pept]|uniref:hypothetical protein n=1 Tax=Pseudothermotoga sp. U03pept TaxID=3447012 RepID=UPI003F0C4853
MAYKFKCLNCGEITYSAAPLEYQKNKSCQNCGGKIIQVYPPMRLGEILLQLEAVTQEELNEALAIQRRMLTKATIGKILLRLQLVNQLDLEKALKIQQEMLSGITH